MKNFVYNTSLGKAFFAEFCNFVKLNGLNGRSDFYDDVFMMMFDVYLSLSNEHISQLNLIAYRYDLLMEFRAESDCLIVEFSLN